MGRLTLDELYEFCVSVEQMADKVVSWPDLRVEVVFDRYLPPGFR